MSEARKAQVRHPSTAIPREMVEEIAYRLYLQRLEPPLTPAESVAREPRQDKEGKVIPFDATVRKNSASYLPLVRAALRVLWDMGLITKEAAA